MHVKKIWLNGHQILMSALPICATKSQREYKHGSNMDHLQLRRKLIKSSKVPTDITFLYPR